MGFLLNWLFLERAFKKHEAKMVEVDKVLSESEAVAELAERNPELREALRTLGIKTKPTPPRGG